MNIKRIIAITLVVLIACLACAGVASAFTVKKGAETTPSGSLVPGNEVTSNMQITYYSGDMDTGSTISLGTDLVGQSWTVVIYKGGSELTTMHPTYDTGYMIKSFDLSGYNTDLTLDISVKGSVSSESAGSSISAIKITESGVAVRGQTSYSSPSQKVYDTGVLAGNLQTLISNINSLESTISELIAGGHDCSAAKANLETARAKYQAAVAAGTDQGVAAFAYYEEGAAAFKQAKQSVAYTLLSVILTYTSQIDDTITQLYGNGWNSEAKLIDTKNTKIKSSYDTCLKAYQSENANIAELVSLRNEASAVNDEANQYLEDSQNVFAGVLSILPFILIGVGVIVVGIIVFFLIRRRKNSWDELG